MAGSLVEARQGATATMLDDGRVLVAGGANASGTLASAEIVSANGVSAAVAIMNTARSGHTATKLKDGRVLLTGGTDANGAALASAEIFTPETGTWTTVAMTTARRNHTATLANDGAGTVVVAGGENANGALASIEAFSPSTDSFNLLSGSLSSPRTRHAAAALPAGLVLVAGGMDGAAALATADIVDGTTGGVMATGAMNAARASFTATDLVNGDVVAIGGATNGGELNSAEVFVFDTGQWLPAGSMFGPRQGHAAVRLAQNGGVLIVGGTEAGAAATRTEIFLPRSRVFSVTGPSGAHAGGVAGNVGAGGQVLAAGGGGSAAVEQYQYATVMTDKDDYAPGETVTITGSGWQPGEWVALSLLEAPEYDTHPLIAVQAQPDGTIRSTEFSPDAHDLGIRFYLTAYGLLSEAQSTFTDATPTRIQTSSMSPGSGACGATTTVSATLEFKTGPQNAPFSPLSGKVVGFTLGSSTGSGTTNASGVATASLTVPSGATSLVASFAGDITYNPVSSTIAFAVTGSCSATTTTSINAPAITYNANGSVTVTVTASSGTPTGNVLLTVDGGSPVSKTLSSGSATFTNADILALNSPSAGNHTLAADYPAQASFGASSASGTLHVDQTTSIVTVTCTAGAPYTYTGSSQTPCTAEATGVGMSPVDVTSSLVYANNTNAGPATADASWSGDTNHTGNTGTGGFTIGQASSTVTVTCTTGAPYTYTGSPQTPCTAEATGAGMSPVDVTSSLVYANNTNAGPATADASWSGDTNHTGNTGAGGFTIGQASSTVTVICPASVEYTGLAQTPCTAAATGIGISPVNLTSSITYGSNTDVGEANADATWTGDANHTGSTGSATFDITPAPSVTTVTCTAGPFTYTGSPQTPCSVSVTGVGGLSLTPTPAYSNNTNAGTATASYNFTGDANHTGSNDSEDFTIGQAPSTVTVSCTAGAPYTYTGSPLTPCTAEATGAGMSPVDVTSSLVYANNTNAGPATADANWGGDTNHTGNTASGGFTIGQAPSTVAVSCTAGAPYTYTGSPQTPCTAQATGAGMSPVDVTSSLVYANNTNAGAATANASWGGDANHTGNTGSGGFTINKKSLTVTAANKTKAFGDTVTFDGTTPSTDFSVSGLVASDTVDSVTMTSAGAAATATVTSPGPTYPITPSAAIGTGLGNYDIGYIPGTLTINAWSLTGFYSPVGLPNSFGTGPGVAIPTTGLVWNTIKGGQTVPLKFNVYSGGTEKKSTADVQSFLVFTAPCTNTSYEDPIDFTASGGTTLRYDAIEGQFIQNWQSPKGAGQCYRVTMIAKDGSSISTFFKTK